VKKLTPLLAALLVAPLLGSDAPRDYDGRIEAADVNIEGTWQLVGIKHRGQEQPPNGWNLVFQAGGKYAWEGMIRVEGTYKLNGGRTPPHLDLLPTVPGGHTAQCIFRIDGDVLVIVFYEPEEKRPRGFTDEGVKVLTLKRLRK
jgi:uncharacterized protein (TIGR03067 family)